jgi:hypothetical protein
MCHGKKYNRIKYYVIYLEFISKNTEINKAYGSVFPTNATLMWLLIGVDKHIGEINP